MWAAKRAKNEDPGEDQPLILMTIFRAVMWNPDYEAEFQLACFTALGISHD
jgi:hypothetical protein